MSNSAPELNMAATPPRSGLYDDADSAFNSEPRASFLAPSDHAPSSSQLISPADKAENDNFAAAGLIAAASSPLANPSNAFAAEPTIATSKTRRRPVFWVAVGALALAALVLVIVLPVYFTVVKPRNQTNVSSSSHSNGSNQPSAGGSPQPTGSPTSPPKATTGGDGSQLIDDDGNTFTYRNQFGGFWVYNPQDPYNDGARPNSWTPPLNQSWEYGKDRIFGVNLGGLFQLEPFISPALFQKYPGATDEWSLSTLMAADTASGGLSQLEEHYKTFITEEDMAQIAGAGLNWIRLPIPFWAIDIWNGTNGHSPNTIEPFLAKTSWKYILRVLGWARKYGLRVCLDLHSMPGSQNGYNHSGKGGQVNFLFGNMGLANAQRGLSYIRTLTEFINRPEWRNVVPIFGVVNELLTSRVGVDVALSFYQEAITVMRSVTGTGEGKGPYMAIHDGFRPPKSWAGTMNGADRVMLDSHPYFAFSDIPTIEPMDTGTNDDSAGGTWPRRACQAWGQGMRDSQSGFGITFAGEFSNGFNDCALFLRGVPGSSTYPGNCNDWIDYRNWTPGTKAGLKAFAEASMDALGDYFFWTWKVGNSTAGFVQAPLWSYKLGLEQGWMPTDPRTAIGKCQRVGVSISSFETSYSAWQTGGAGAGTIVPSATQPWPPPQISGDNGNLAPAQLPLYATTGTEVRLAGPTSISSASIETTVTGGPIEVSGCAYPNAYDAITPALPGGVCTGSSLAARELAAPTQSTFNAAPASTVTPPPAARGSW